jgi:hypothetical protein
MCVQKLFDQGFDQVCRRQNINTHMNKFRIIIFDRYYYT